MALQYHMGFCGSRRPNQHPIQQRRQTEGRQVEALPPYKRRHNLPTGNHAILFKSFFLESPRTGWKVAK